MNIDILQTDIVIENEQVKLIPFSNARHKELTDIIFHDEIWKYMGMFVRTEADFQKYVDATLKSQSDGVCYPFSIIDKKSNRIAGSSRYGYLGSSTILN